MRRNYALEQHEVDAGYVLTCQPDSIERSLGKRCAASSTNAPAEPSVKCPVFLFFPLRTAGQPG